LIAGFNEMLAEIESRAGEASRYQDTLERTVAARTTELVAANRDLETARDRALDASRAKSEFLANMSHEIRTPMNGIIGMTELALDSPLSAQQKDWLETVQLCSVSLLKLLNDILDLSKIESRRLELEAIPFSLEDLVEDTLRALAPTAHGKGLELVADVDPHVPSGFLGDPVRIAQVLTNLTSNAVKFTEHGYVLVRVRVEEVLTDERMRLHLSVADTGIGIPDDKREVIFESFRQADGSTTRRYGGTGLGLTISATLVHLMGGDISVDSQPGEGSTFAFAIDLPIAAVPERSFGRDLSGLRVLIVDDSHVNCEILTEWVRRWGMVPTATRSGPDAIQWVRDASTTTQPYNVILLDANMPELDGFTVAQQITADVVSLPPIIVLTSSSAQGDSVRCRQLGISGSLTKPIRPRALYDLVSAAVARGQSDTKPTPDDLGPTVRKFRVLVAEDNVINQKAVTSLLVPRGHVVDVVANGADAVRAVQRQEYDLVLMDVQMPEMSGMEATRTIRTLEANTARHTRIVAVTAHAMKGDREECLAAGMDGYLAKPIRPRRASIAVRFPAAVPL
jgi:signal transduction histidine kinase/CheY-like chemotaxis protein